jgi:hypothetical protein
MATRVAKYKFASMSDFLDRWDSQLSKGSFFLEPGAAPTDLAAEFKLDLLLPLGQRLGPFTCQVVHRDPGGGVGIQIPEISGALQKDIDLFFDGLDEIKDWYLKMGEVVLSSEVPDVAALQAQLDRLQTQLERQPAAGSGEAPVAGPRQRGFILPNLDDTAPSADGPMGDETFRDLLMILAIERTTGLMTITRPDGSKKWGFWIKGGPVGWRSEPIQPDETLGILLLKAERIHKGQLAESLQIMEDQNLRQGEALIDMGILNFGQLVTILEKQVAWIFQNIMANAEGSWSFTPMNSFEERFITPPMRVPSMLYRALRDQARNMPRALLLDNHKPNLDKYVHFNPQSSEVLDEIAFPKAEGKFLGVILSNSWRLRELFTVTNLSRNQTACVLWALDELHILDFRDSEDLGRYLERVSNRVLSKVRTLRKASHFDVLEIHWVCLQTEVEDASERMLKEFDEDSFHDLTDELKKGITEIRKRVEQSHAYLSIKKNRTAYREEILEKDMILNSASHLAEKGEMAIMKGDGREAITCWTKAIELIGNTKKLKEGLQRARSL